MVYNYKEVLNKYGSTYQLGIAITKKEIMKIEEGIYSDKEYSNEIEILTKKYPNAIFTMNNAFYFYDLTDVIPRKYYLAIQKNRKKINYPNVEMVYMSNEFFEVGKVQLDIGNGVIVNCYDKERMLIELIRNRKKIPYDYYKEILNNFRERAETLEIRKIEEYLNYFKNKNNIFEIIRNEVY
ncbi:MAG: hypothetical protein RSF02_01950 [Bacilli bacterium]